MLSEEELEQVQTAMEGVLDRLLREPDCDEEVFQALILALAETETAFTAGLRAKLEHMQHTSRIGGAMTEAYERSIPELICRNEGFILLLCDYRSRHQNDRGNETISTHCPEQRIRCNL